MKLKISFRATNGLMMPAFRLDLDREDLSWIDKEDIYVEVDIIDEGKIE
jgi:hypothetical protein